MHGDDAIVPEEVDLRDGPEKCSARCSECEGTHHWIVWSIDPDDEEEREEWVREHPALADDEELMLAHYACKHCPAVGGFGVPVDE